MKKILNLIILVSSIVFFNTCSDMDVYPSDLTSTGSIKDTDDGLINVTNGNYALFKDGIEFQGIKDDNNCYVRQYFQMSDFSTDDIVCGQKTEDPLYYSFTYTHSPDQSNAKFFWYISYKIISGANTAIETLEAMDELSESESQLLGENYFLRAFCNFNLVRFYAKPYALSEPSVDLGVIIRKSTSESGEKARATIKETYNEIITDAERAIQLMNSSRGAEYASKEAAEALLSRVYLNMDNHEKTIEYSTQVIKSNRFSLESASSIVDYFPNAISRGETIWLIALTDNDNRGKFGSIASMIYSDGNSGWGEEFASVSYRKLLNQFPKDVRASHIVTGEVDKKNGIEVFYITKFSFQNGDANLSSPVMFRLSEMYLNRAEAYAKQEKIDLALDDVNLIRTNRGLQDDLYTSVPSDKTILDIVLEERRLELAFEGHRFFDVFRNKQNMDRSYWGYHIKDLTVGEIDFSTAPPTDIDNLIINWDDNAKLYYIPSEEINSNKLCIQN